MRRLIGKAAGGLGVAVVVVLALFVVSMRTKYAPAQRAVRRMNRATWNPQAMKTAGQPGAAASVIRHVGRTSGAAYETPVGVVETESGFVVALPYGTSADWLKNVLAAGTAVVVHEGNTFKVDQPEVVPEVVAAAYFGPGEQRTHRIFGVDEFLLLNNAGLG